jgi:hypothetical protein
MIFLKKSWYDHLESGEGRMGLTGVVLVPATTAEGVQD